MFASLSAASRLVFFVVLTLVCMVVYLPMLALRWRYRSLAQFYWKTVAIYVFKAEIVVRGALTDRRPLLCVSNHMSYLDIVILGALVPGCFVSKAEVRKWPGINIIAIIGRTVFVDRRPASAARQRDQIAAHLAEEPLILFPEGTSSDGNRVLPFKSALFNVVERAAEDAHVAVQPLSIAYTRQGGVPMGYAMHPFYAWYGDMDLAPHVWEVLRRGRFTVEVELKPSVTIEAFKNRKELARWCETTVRHSVADSLYGHRVSRSETKNGVERPGQANPS